MQRRIHSPSGNPRWKYCLEDSYVSGSYHAEDGTELATYDYELPVLRCYREDGTEITEAATPEEERALEIAETFNQKFDSWRTEDENLVEAAQADYTMEAGAGTLVGQSLLAGTGVYGLPDGLPHQHQCHQRNVLGRRSPQQLSPELEF